MAVEVCDSRVEIDAFADAVGHEDHPVSTAEPNGLLLVAHPREKARWRPSHCHAARRGTDDDRRRMPGIGARQTSGLLVRSNDDACEKWHSACDYPNGL